MPYNFTGKSVVLTGGLQGLGQAVLKKFLKCGANVTVGDYAGPAATEKCIAALKEANLPYENASFIEVDISKIPENEKLFNFALEKYGKVDIIQPNAGIGHSLPFLDTSFDKWRRYLEINLDGLFQLNSIAIRYWIENNRPGIIVNTSSIAAVVSLNDLPAYSASKAGVTALTKSIAKDFAGRGIRANTVNPGYMRTAMFDNFKHLHAEFIKKIPQGDFGQPEDIANAVAFLASDEAKYINGHSLIVDGAASL